MGEEMREEDSGAEDEPLLIWDEAAKTYRWRSSGDPVDGSSEHLGLGGSGLGRTDDPRRAMSNTTAGCLLAALWVVGGGIVVLVSMLQGFSGSWCDAIDPKECERQAAAADR